MNKSFDKAAFKQKLDEQSNYPTLYMFKFIVPANKADEVSALFPKHKVTLKASSEGKYVSATIKAMMPSSDAILEIYEQAASIEGVISL